ncbi:efflux transporter outer membrane subunit [Desulfoferrobacter suflitae]|uniref:efflux transporter outer membrane subunit n=1 Tax=Desulfoferrobacter suflitae TaxID=2865782 RepID=UPI00216459EE|nr:efflux transporter outer membrane subunit [Desulfoferrobacter suflitae]MCK8603351.1 efflux transporter outer membrane subunit [Desulfoferrobacter suflitae]
MIEISLSHLTYPPHGEEEFSFFGQVLKDCRDATVKQSCVGPFLHQAFLLFLALFLTSCTTVGPDHLPPTSEMPEAWRSVSDVSLATDRRMNPAWWSVFDDPVLDRLIERASTGNLDLKTAVARVKEARAGVGVVTGVYFPQIDAQAELAAQRGSENALAGIGLEGNRYALGLDSIWEIDLFGRITRSVEAAAAVYQATREDRRDVQVSLYAEVARNYLTVRTLQARLAATLGNIKSQRQILDLTRTRFRYGLATDLDVAQAEDVLANSEAQVPPLRSALSQTINTVALLLGQAPGAVHAELSEAKPIPLPPLEVAVGVPADLLRQRPDIRRAEREVAAQTARIGIATADLYPTLTLLGTVGLEAENVGDLFSGGSHFYTLGPSLRWNVFAGGSIRSRIQVEDAKAEQALLQYEQTVLRALNEVENAMTAYLEERRRLEALKRSVSAARRTLKLAVQLYKDGLRDFQNVLDAERNVFDVENQLAMAQGNLAINLVQIYRALGGGWEAEVSQTGEGIGRHLREHPQPAHSS